MASVESTQEFSFDQKLAAIQGLRPHAGNSVWWRYHDAAWARDKRWYCAMDGIEMESLDDLHKRKIDLADSVFILNVGGYVGDSTRSEIAYARQLGKPIQYLEAAGSCLRCGFPGGEDYGCPLCDE